jgi:NodT family efflux transporter outer membrane factor (OMF) lipoprotein
MIRLRHRQAASGSAKHGTVRAFGPAGAALLLAGCVVGPQHPTTPLSLSPPVAPTTVAPFNGPAQAIVTAAPLPDWWRQFGNETLNTLVAQAIAHNNDLAMAEATLRQAAEQAGVTAGDAGPQVDASFNSQRYKVSRIFSNPLNDPSQYRYTLHTATVSVTYPLDLFGLERNRIRSARAQAEMAANRAVAARTTVIANLVLAVINNAALKAQVDAAEASIRSNRDIVNLLIRRQQLGDIGAVDVTAQQTALANAEAVLPSLRRQRIHALALIDTLVGQAPGTPLPDLPTLDQLQLPATLPVALPADIVANRPDVAAAAAQMRGAGNDLGAAIAARLPNITLTANAGGQSTQFTDLFAHGNLFYTLIGAVTQPIFHGKALLHGQRAAEAALEGAKAQYRQSVLLAFTDVSDALGGLQTDGAALDAATRASTAASQTLLFTRRQLELGGAGTLQLLNASAANAQASASVVQARAARLSDTVALFQAVGGGFTPAG